MGKWDEEFQKVLAETLVDKGTSYTTSNIPSTAKSARGISSGSNSRTHGVGGGSFGVTGSAGAYMQNKANVRNGVFGTLSSSYASYKPSSRITSRMTVGKKKKDEEEKLDFFKKGAFEDGYDFGDVAKTILGTAGDFGVATVRGAGGLLEGIADGISHGIAYGYDLAGNKERADEIHRNTAENTIERWTQGLDDLVDKNSILGRSTTGAVESIGQWGTTALATTAAVTLGAPVAAAAAIPAILMGASGFGSGISEAYEGDATDKEALKHGLNSAVSEAIPELIFGGMGKTVKALGLSKGLTKIDDVIAVMASSKFKSQTAKNLAEAGVKMTAEGLEEVISGATQAISKHSTYMSEEELGQILKDENLLEQFIVGALVSGASQSGYIPGTKNGSIREANAQGRDFITGLSQNEQSVVNKEVEKRISEKGKVNANQKAKLYEEVLRDMDKGRISIETIEEVLGGDSYQTYKNAMDSAEDNAILKEFEELGSKEGATPKDNLRYAEMSGHVKEILANRETLKSNLSSKVSEFVRGDRLSESYNEIARRTQKFEADLTKYDAKQAEIVQKAIDSGVLNNTNRSHEFVDVIAKIHAEKGIPFDFTNNAKLKESGFAVEGATVDGFVNENGITINMQSPKAWQTTVGHEITHVLKGTEFYTELQNVLFEYAKPKGDYKARYDALYERYKEVYKDVTPEEYEAKINEEVAADLVGEYLFTDENFVNNLSATNRNVFQKVYDEIKYLCKVATAGSKEARQIEKIKKVFDKAWKDAAWNQTDTKYSISETTDGRFVAVVDNDILSNIDTSEWNDETKKAAKKAANEELKKFSNGFTINGIEYIGNKDSRDEYIRSNYSETLGRKNPEAYFDKMRATSVLDDVIRVATDWENDGYLKHERDDYVDFVRGKTLIKSGDNTYRAVVLAGITEDGKAIFHDVEDICSEAFEIKESESSTAVSTNNSSNVILEDSDTNKLTQEGENVKFSLSVDSDGRKLSEGQQEWFKDSKVRDENGSLLTVYHGSKNNGFNVFQYSKDVQTGTDYGEAYYFTSDRQKASGYSYDVTKDERVAQYQADREALKNRFLETRSEEDKNAFLNYRYEGKKLHELMDDETYLTEGGEVKELYLNLKNPLVVDAGGKYYYDVYPKYFDKARKNGNDGIIVKNVIDNPRGEARPIDTYIAFNQEQIKNVDNLNPTDNPDIRYSLSDIPSNPNGYATPASDLMYAPVSETENVAPVAEPVEVQADNSEMTTTAPTFPERTELDVLKDERKVLEDTLMSMVEAQETGEKFQELSKKWSEVNRKIEAYENNLTDGEGNTGDIAPAEARSDAPYFVSEDVASIVDKMVTQDTEAGENTFAEPYVVYSVDDYVIQRRISRDGQKYSYTIITPDGAFRRGLVDQNGGAFYADVADKLTNLMMEAGGYNNDVEDVEVEDEADYPTAATAPVRVVSTDKGDYLKADKTAFDEDGYNPVNKIPGKQARILTEQPIVKKNQTTKKADTLDVDTSKKGKLSPIKMLQEYFVDNGYVFEKLSKKTKNRSLEAKWNFNRYSRGMAQHLISHGSKADNVPSLKGIADKVEKAGLTADFYNYLGHYRNIDGMTLDVRYKTANKGVFGNDVTAAMSQNVVDSLEKQHPEFKEWAEEVYAYNNYLLDMSVEGGLITQELADRLKDMYPHFVPIARVGVENAIEYDDSAHVGVNSPIKHATGGNQDIMPLFDTMAERTLATFNAVNMNDFGVELFGTLYPGRSQKNTSLDPTHSNAGMKVEDLDSLFDPQAELLQSGENGNNPTFSVFLDGERHTFDITHEMYEAMKPTSDALAFKMPVLSQVSDIRRKLITEYNPWFMLKNAIKDSQDVLINSQHPLKTYGEMLFEAPMELFAKGQWYQEYMANGGDQNSYFDTDNVSLKEGKKAVDTLKKITGLEAISKANSFIETVPRLAEYIASRKSGRSIQVSMLDAARVTTNFAAGGKATKFLNRNGATFLNASVQGAVQFGRNFAEAKQNGLKGFVSLAARMGAVGFIPEILNRLMWDDDEDYQKLPDYITNNYYVPFKYGDGQFVRIPKGRVAAVLQNAVEQLDSMTAEGGKADWEEFFKLVAENIAPNNPVTDNIFAPIGQVVSNKTWYGEDLIPYRLKDLETTEQYDEKTSSVAVWLSEQLQDIPLSKWMDLSPKEIHYLIDQYSGVVGDTLLPFSTPKAESPNDSFLGKMIAPLRDIFTTDSVLNDRVTGDFYETLEAAEALAESEDATPEDKFKSDLLIGYNVEISKLMQEQRDIQTSDLPDSEKYKRNRELKKEINALQEKGLEALNDYKIDGVYAESGDKRYNFGYDTENEKERWFEIKPKKADGTDNGYYQQEQRITKDLGISYKEYWNNREMYDDFYYVAGGYDKDSPEDDTIETARAVFGYKRFAEYAKELKKIKADKDANGEVIKNSKYPKVQAYVNSLDIPDIEKKILYTMQYPNYRKYKEEIVKYLDQNDDISYDSFWKILDELDYKVDNNGRVTWY